LRYSTINGTAQKIIIISLFLLFLVQPIINSLSSLNQKLPYNDINFTNNENRLLIIIPKKFVGGQINKLSDYKNNRGIENIVKTTEYVYNNFAGQDNSEKIKYCIKWAFDEWGISSVLLIGDFRDIPVRYCYNNDGFHSLEPYFISDLYYADLYDDQGFFSSWNDDGDSLFGEWNGQCAEDDEISLTPEVSVGRLPCSNRFELKTMIDKIIRYENALDYDEWFHRIVVAGGDTYSEARGYNDSAFRFYEGEEQAKKVMNVMTEFQSQPLFASEGTLSTFSVFKSIWNGCGFLYLSGHGSPGVWCTHPPNSVEKVGNFPNLIIPLLRNKDKLPVCVVGACQVSKFDVHPMNVFRDSLSSLTWFNKCWSWKLTSSPNGGAIAILGCTGLSWMGMEYGGGGSDWLELEFFKEYANGTTILGDIWKNVITRYVNEFPIDWDAPSGETSSLDAKTVQEWALIGDPTLKIKV